MTPPPNKRMSTGLQYQGTMTACCYIRGCVRIYSIKRGFFSYSKKPISEHASFQCASVMNDVFLRRVLFGGQNHQAGPFEHPWHGWLLMCLGLSCDNFRVNFALFLFDEESRPAYTESLALAQWRA